MKYLKEHEDFLKENRDLPRKELAIRFNERFKSNVSGEALKQKCIKLKFFSKHRNGFPKGHVPFNKGLKGYTGANRTSFAKGNIPANKKEVGTIVTRKDKTSGVYKYIKVAEPNKWELLHAYIYKQHFGEIPKGYCVMFKDKNTLNFSIDNLIPVKRCELVRLNKSYANIDESLRETALNIIRVKEASKRKIKQKEI